MEHSEGTASAKKGKFALKGFLPVALSILGFIVGILTFSFGSGVFLKPVIRISAGTAPLMLEPNVMSDLFMVKMSLASPEMMITMTGEVGEHLNRLGMPKEKAKIIMEGLEKQRQLLDVAFKGATAPDKMKKMAERTELDLDFKAHELRILQSAFMLAADTAMKPMQDFLSFPDSVVFFQIKNDGRADAEDVQISINLGGSYYSKRIYAENQYTAESDGSSIKIRQERISSGAKIRGLIWYDRASTDSSEANKILVTHKGGTVEANLKEELYFVGDR